MLVFKPPKYGLGPRVPEEEEPELIAMPPFLALGHRWPWGVSAQDWGKWAWAEGPPWELRFVVFYKQ